MKALVLWPDDIGAARSGYHLRTIAITQALIDAELNVVVCVFGGKTQPTTHPLLEAGTLPVTGRTYVSSAVDTVIMDRTRTLSARLGRKLPPASFADAPPGARRWMARVVTAERPDLIVTSYVKWAGLLESRTCRALPRVIDMIDLLSLNNNMGRLIGEHLPPFPLSSASADSEVLALDFQSLHPSQLDPQELAVLDRFDATIAISQSEAAIVRAGTEHTNVVHLPMTFSVRPRPGSAGGPALLIGFHNPFNLQGYLWFVKQVLPIILAEVPDFRLRVVGRMCEALAPEPGIELAGVVPDVGDEYSNARFAICPIFGGTGQKVKIVEAMAFGHATVSLESAALESPLLHSQNGFIAANAQQFADYCVTLWRDPVTRSTIGAAAAKSISNEAGSQRAKYTMAEIVEKVTQR